MVIEPVVGVLSSDSSLRDKTPYSLYITRHTLQRTYTVPNVI